jgi:hypothetical protein
MKLSPLPAVWQWLLSPICHNRHKKWFDALTFRTIFDSQGAASGWKNPLIAPCIPCVTCLEETVFALEYRTPSAK